MEEREFREMLRMLFANAKSSSSTRFLVLADFTDETNGATYHEPTRLALTRDPFFRGSRVNPFAL